VFVITFNFSSKNRNGSGSPGSGDEGKRISRRSTFGRNQGGKTDIKFRELKWPTFGRMYI
jgi:hypothetical protein